MPHMRWPVTYSSVHMGLDLIVNERSVMKQICGADVEHATSGGWTLSRRDKVNPWILSKFQGEDRSGEVAALAS